MVKIVIIGILFFVCVMPPIAVADYWPDPAVDTLSAGQGVADCRGEALGLAAGEKNYNFGTYRLQGSAGLGYFDGCSAINLGLAIRFPDRSIMWSGSIGATEGGNFGYSAGANWYF